MEMYNNHSDNHNHGRNLI